MRRLAPRLPDVGYGYLLHACAIVFPVGYSLLYPAFLGYRSPVALPFQCWVTFRIVIGVMVVALPVPRIEVFFGLGGLREHDRVVVYNPSGLGGLYGSVDE